MKRLTTLIIMVLLALESLSAERLRRYDVCIYGATSAGVIAAYSAAKLGHSVIIIEPTNHIGGMTTGGLGYTDIGNKQVVTGLSKRFYRAVGAHYGHLEQWIFEPHVADSILRSYLRHPNITVRCHSLLDRVQVRNATITSIEVKQGLSEGRRQRVDADYYIDCSYEGDLMAKAGVSYIVGREANNVYGETYNGVQLMTRHQFPDGIDPYIVPGDVTSGLVWGVSDEALASDGSGDDKVQAYNYRICLTNRPENMIPITRPDNYDSTRYELMLRLIAAQPGKRRLNDYFIWSQMPNGKTDVNNRGGFSTDMIGANHHYPEADYAKREQIVAAHSDYTRGMLYFFGHDERVPSILREQMLQWGYPKDEYVDNGNWTPQLYVREARRMVGEYVMTQACCQGREVVDDGVAMAAYTMDSHNCQRVVVIRDGRPMVKNEGNVEIGGGLPYPISYRSITPKRTECTNLIVPVCLSASHIAYGSIRMEPVFMVLAQASAIASHIAIERGKVPVQRVASAEVVAIMDKNPYLDGTPSDVVADDNMADVERSDMWRVVKREGGYGPTYLELQPTASTQYVKYPLAVKQSGRYDLYIYKHFRDGVSRHINLSIAIGESVVRREVDASRVDVKGQTSGEWLKVGEFDFNSATKAYVLITNDNEREVLIADAVLLIKHSN